MFGFRGLQRQESYSGTESFRHIDGLINDDGRELRVVSPFISSHYAKMLADVARRKRVYVLVSEARGGKRFPSQEKAVALLQAGGRDLAIKPALFMLVLLAISFALGLFLAFGVLLLVTAAVVYFGILTRMAPERNLHLKMVRDAFIHEKLFVSDSVAIVGSANLTYSGTHKNIEHIEIIRDRRKIEDLRAHFDRLWRTYKH